ncbi:MAG TPA: transglutaminaseTgpA domain-containing protein [Candidatus Nitrosotalea sp.]|nr:transglutaminaseTgpA domain-containing protein [Candidatus Nitrosotalea sp.]
MASLRSLHLPRSPIEDSALARVFCWAALAVAGVSIAIYGGDLILAPACVALAGLGHLVSHRRRHVGRRWPGQVVLALLILACLAYFLSDSVVGLFGGTLPQANFALLLAAVTSFDLRTRRNLYSSFWIGLAVLYLAAVYAWDYPFGVLVLAWMLCLAGFWCASHLRRLGVSPRLPPVAVAALAAGLGVGLGVFWLLPQPQANPPGPLVLSLPAVAPLRGEVENPVLPLVSLSGPGAQGSSVDLHYRGRLGQRVVMYVRTGAPGYWRGLVFDTYRAGVWTASLTTLRAYPPYVDPSLLPGPAAPQLGTFLQVYRVVAPLPGVILAAAPVQSLYYPALALNRDPYGTFHVNSGIPAGQTYSVVSYLPDLSPVSLRAASGPDPVNPVYLDPGPLSAAARALARTAVATAAPDRYDRVMALTNYLQQHYTYSQELGHVPSGQDPVDWFLFHSRTGYCEQFASAETLMLRSLGIPARLATGYSTGSYNPNLDQSVVRAQDAHAWVEVHFPGRGWVPVDPSPGYPALAASRFPDRWAASGLARLIPHIALSGAPSMLLVGRIALIPAAAIGLVLVGALALWWLRRRLPIVRRRGTELDLLQLYERLQGRARLARMAPETPLEYARRSSSADPPEVLLELTRAVNDGVYGGRWPAPADLARWRKRIR